MSAQPSPITNEACGGIGPGAPPIDAQKLLEQCMGNVALVSMLFDKFETQARDDIIRITQAVHARDAGVASRVSHALKGAAGALAAHEVQRAAADIELAAREGRLESATQSLRELTLEVERCLAYLVAARSGLGGTANTAPARRGAP